MNRKHLFTAALGLALICWPPFHALPQNTKPALGPGRRYTTVQRLQPERLRAVHEARLQFERQRRPVKYKTGLNDYRAILHAHAEDATHTGGTRPEMLAAAQRDGIKIILLTDHVRPPRDFINDSWRGLREGVLFIPGAEAEGFLVYPQASIMQTPWKTRDEYIGLVTQNGGNMFLSHVEERPDWPTDKLDGLEIYNHHTDIKDEGEFMSWLLKALADPPRLRMLQDALRDYPQEVMAAQQDYLAAIIAKWDRDLLTHRATGIAANDCHHNQVFTVKAISNTELEITLFPDEKRRVNVNQAPQIAELLAGNQPGEQIAKLDFDPYERSMRYVSTHILTRALNEASVRQALHQGHAYVAHDWLCDATGFVFAAEQLGKRKPLALQGDDVAWRKNLQLRVETPLPALLKLYRNGQVVQETRGAALTYAVREPGVYRVEAWLEVDGEQRPWIYANPIRIGLGGSASRP
ncbi:MAG: histidinol phosphatase [Acidobacteria bacterium]|nr:histidinol phosphatase [Acidobacteriota bacterium]MBI3426268.1 histidinol phosphatase [Acidobacteriota bacterium]